MKRPLGGPFRGHPRSRSRFLLVALLELGGGSCAPHAGIERLPNGDLRATCNEPLAPCLVPVAERCAAHGYDVLSASEHREETGSPPQQQVITRSEATVRCRQAVPLFGRDPNQVEPPRVTILPVASASAAGPPRCVPGQSVACATTSGCSGAQVCAADGTHFGACECAASPAAAPSAEPAPDGGVP